MFSVYFRNYLSCQGDFTTLSVKKETKEHKGNKLLVYTNPNPKIYSLKKDIFKYFIESQLYLEVPQFIPTSHLIKAIAALKGVDQRTINKYLKLLEGFGCIKKSGMSQYEFV